MNTVNYDFLEKELLENMLINLKNEELNKGIICEQISILAVFGIINAEQIRELSCFKYYDDYKCYATYFYDPQHQHHNTELIKTKSKTLASALILLEKQDNFIARTSFSEVNFKVYSPKNRDRRDDQSMIFALSDNLINTIENHFISKEFIDDDCVVYRKKAINTVRRKLLDQILQINPPEISNRAYRNALKKFEFHFAQNQNITDNIKLFLYRSLETTTYQNFIDMISSDSIEDTDFNRTKFQEMVQILVVLQRINANQIIQLCSKSFDRPGLLPISILSTQAAMDISFNIQLEISSRQDQECNKEFSLNDFEATARQSIDQAHDLDFYEFAFSFLERSFIEMLDIKRAHNESFDDLDYQRLLTLLLARKLSIKDYVALKLEFDF